MDMPAASALAHDFGKTFFCNKAGTIVQLLLKGVEDGLLGNHKNRTQQEGMHMAINADDVIVPLDVPKSARDAYINNYLAITRKSGRLMLFAGDQKVEHLNDDFYGEGIHTDDGDPEHLFRIASHSNIGVFATQLGLIARYGMHYPDVPYLIKLNSKTNLVKTSQSDPFSNQGLDVQKVVDFRASSGLNILAVGYTLYLGSEYEADMLHQAARIVYNAHQRGLITVLWVYPRGKAVVDEKDPHLIAGATGVAACLGSDFVKVNYPKKKGHESKKLLKEAVLAAGRTKVVCAGGSSVEVKGFLQRLHDQIFVSGASGNATGRNIHQKSLEDARRMCDAIYAITVNGDNVQEAMKEYNSELS
jgi:DhnA family fructose-bisphosphate aldolase class Ia